MVRTPCPNCRAEPFKVSATAPRPRKKGRFGVAIADRHPSPPWDPRLPEIGTGARTSQYASDTVRISDVRASRCMSNTSTHVAVTQHKMQADKARV